MAQAQLFGYPLALLAYIEGELVDVTSILKCPVPTPGGGAAIELDLDAFLDVAHERELKRA